MQIKVGDLVKADPWIYEGAPGIILSIQELVHCASAYVLMGDAVELIRLDNLKVLNESR
jgi:hypothetical protein